MRAALRPIASLALTAVLAVVFVFVFLTVTARGADAPAAPAPPAAPPPAADPQQTLKTLQAASDGESNAHAKYLAFAKKADEEGYAKVASLFRAAARAEEVHAKNHAGVIESLGGTPKADVQAVDVKSTKENVQAALKGESYERDQMYPGFIRQARIDKNNDAVQTFTRALKAEAEHAKLYREALNNLEKWKGGEKMTFYVCSVCGYTTTKMPAKKCPSCFEPVDLYETID